jgi:hypothetical protein
MIYFSILIVIGLLVLWFYKANKANFQLNCWSFNEGVDEIVDMLLRAGIESGIASLKMSQYDLTIEFCNGKTMRAWNGNKYYAWLGHGRIGEYVWSSARPSTEAMVLLRDAIKQYYLR